MKRDPIDPDRIRKIPLEGFSWIDRRFVREAFIKRLHREAAFLYLFLTAVSDAKGVSFYGDRALAELLKLTAEELSQARGELINQGLILYGHPLYQVLPLPTTVKRNPRADSMSSAPKRREAPSCNENLMSFREFMQLKGCEKPKDEEACHE